MQRRTSTVQLVRIGIFVALLCICAFLVFPIPGTPVFFSLHTVSVVLIGLLLPTIHGVYTMTVYIIMGLIGLPVFASGSAGPGKLFGPTGGFYFGFFAAVILISLVRRGTPSLPRFLIASLLGLPIWHAFGIFFACLFGGLTPTAAFFAVSLPFLIGDILKCILAAIAALALQKHLKI